MDREALAAEFETHRVRLHAVARRILGSATEADDAVQEAWLRLSRSDSGSVASLPAWLTTVTGRICLDMLRSRAARHASEELIAVSAPADPPSGDDPERDAILADAVEVALLVVLETLTPAERLAFVLHDLFAVSYDEIAVVVGRSPAAARQLASRARRRVQGGSPSGEADAAHRRAVVDAFLAASRGGDLATLLELLDPDVVVRVDEAAARAGGHELRGADMVARYYRGRAQGATPALIDGVPGALVVTPAGRRLAVTFTVTAGRIIAIDATGDPAAFGRVELVP
ncbi:sigma-70 family RNA polymerase sigma factor [Actinoplanes sp. NPDC051851]|uniref:sigma-70 family RNA polymerase sigma factor n=1 Tax=Actinoplanes sp. NPDC051851 TaxID=3154753 RepID=UPI0034375B2B